MVKQKQFVCSSKFDTHGGFPFFTLDVLMAAETGSGKTGAFCLPVLQIVYETLKDIQGNKGNTIEDKKPNKAFLRFQMNAFDRTPAMGE